MAWIGNDSHKLRLQSSGVLDRHGPHRQAKAARKGIDNRFFYSRLISDFWDAKAGVQFSVLRPGDARRRFLAGVEGLAPYGIHVDAVAGRQPDRRR